MVHNQDLFVMGPEESILSDLIRRSLHKYVRMQVQQRIFGVDGINGDSGADVSVNNDKYLDTFLGFLLQESI
jgi:hypothetical protein